MSGYKDIKDRKVILLVEDDEDFSFMNSLLLEQNGFNVLQAKDGELALELAELYDGVIRLVLLDVLMPKKDGFEVLAELRKRNILKNIPVFMLTNLDNPKDREHAQRLGAEAYLIKSNFTPRQILEKVQTALSSDAAMSYA
ncbi:hypothetical protein A3C91_03390 [Candidatus Azambacteria bacterium RIFCSPHIGHO2_02_FULL_52_12]|uniref:Response regulatory domain-containing protein n=1 Tax=Candidatus Azambacteria bacterium RIFCSPLOWO2_01_FULL_46_25 TaxID=1797298 RepID=A0A1F5BU20_9BACT|nr:MAG: hypothetical protein A3C91_03390 [Candidatus Azambacteria bacterium RIFCSPHIGHO2_02_FULL_52_12]OGD34113.1 MAG: hypothetical protein A2988_01365 [Candidatus Azambacteria bacterium RIFCSPLOWO2_01_FULL_46_25]OGD36712.1 MAG: hypothetical protein A2850_00320 [Candidatus Azambacteria bacterium RIFCSPHIGHO2_01_FULL_51_74]